MTERDIKILKKIIEKQNELFGMTKDYNINFAGDLSKVHPVVRRGIVAFVADIFELTKPLSESVQAQLPFNNTIIKRFRNTSSHQYGTITDTIAHACLMHCSDKNIVNAINKLINDNSITENPLQRSEQNETPT